MYTFLPVIIFLIPQFHQQITCHVLEDLFVFGGEMFFPFAGLARAEGGRTAGVDG